MDELTPNLKLKKPGYDSLADIMDINSNMDKIDAASVQASTAAKNANQAAERAEEAAQSVDTAKQQATDAADKANEAADKANTAATDAEEATGKANASATKAETATQAANEAAQTAVQTVNDAAAYLLGMDAEAHGLPAGEAPTAAVTEEDGHAHFTFGVPAGAPGKQGETGPQGLQGLPGKIQSVWGVTSDDAGDAKPEIGGRNLLKNSDIKVENNLYNVADYYYGNEHPIVGQTYTVQIKGTLADSKTSFDIYDSNDLNFLYGLTRSDLRDEIFTATFVWDQRTPYETNTDLKIYSAPKNVAGTSSIEWIKLEKGVVPTDWSPAPEDTVIPHNYAYDGVNLQTVFGTAEALHNAVAAGDFSRIRIGDYWPITLNGTIHDYAANADKTLNKAVMNMEVAAINPYWRYGDSGDTASGKNHILLVSRDLLPWKLQFRSDDTTWYNPNAENPWLGSALYETLNNPANGVLPRVLDTDLGPYVYAGAAGKGMRWLGEIKAAGTASATTWHWDDRGRLFLPSEREVWGADVWSEHSYAAGAALQWPIFAGSRRHMSKGLGDGGTRSYWWCESSLSGSASYFCYVSNVAIASSAKANDTFVGAPVCFLFV